MNKEIIKVKCFYCKQEINIEKEKKSKKKYICDECYVEVFLKANPRINHLAFWEEHKNALWECEVCETHYRDVLKAKDCCKNTENRDWILIMKNLQSESLDEIKKAIDKGINLEAEFDTNGHPQYYPEHPVVRGYSKFLSLFYTKKALEKASKKGYIEIVKILLDKIEKTEKEPIEFCLYKALTEASIAGHIEIVELLLKKEFDINHIDEFTSTPLIQACSCGHFEIAKMLIKYGADVNVIDEDNGCSPLSEAIKGEYIEIVKLLIKHGADINYVSKHIDTALDLALKKGNTEIIKLIGG